MAPIGYRNLTCIACRRPNGDLSGITHETLVLKIRGYGPTDVYAMER